MTLSVENMKEIDMAHNRLLRYCTRRDRDAYHTHNNGAIPHMSSTCVYYQIMLVGHALKAVANGENRKADAALDAREIVAEADHSRGGTDSERGVVLSGGGQEAVARLGEMRRICS